MAAFCAHLVLGVAACYLLSCPMCPVGCVSLFEPTSCASATRSARPVPSASSTLQNDSNAFQLSFFSRSPLHDCTNSDLPILDIPLAYGLRRPCPPGSIVRSWRGMPETHRVPTLPVRNDGAPHFPSPPPFHVRVMMRSPLPLASPPSSSIRADLVVLYGISASSAFAIAGSAPMLRYPRTIRTHTVRCASL